jgi:hypothetical protein
LVQDVDIVNFSMGNNEQAGDVAAQIQQRVRFQGALAFSVFALGVASAFLPVICRLDFKNVGTVVKSLNS